MEEFSRLDEDCLLKGTLVVIVTGRHDGQPVPLKVVRIEACGFR